MIHAKSKEQGLKVKLFMRLSLLEMLLVEFTERSPDVGLKIFWCFVGNLKRVLQDRLGDDFLLRGGWRLG